MAWNYKIKWGETGVYIQLFDKVNEQLIEYINGLIIGHGKFEEIKFQIWDFLEVDHYDIDAKRGEVIGALDKAASIWNKKTKIAILTENEAMIDYTYQYIEEIASTAWECRIFSRIKEAEKWVIKD